MELKLINKLINYTFFTSSNRTFMELKLSRLKSVTERARSSNRTFMELKCNNTIIANISAIRSNRTFMELKLAILAAI